MGLRENRWNENYEKIWQFVNENHRFPSRHHIEEHLMLNWMKYNRKMLAQNKMTPEMAERFKKLTDFVHQFHTVNQYR